MTGCTSGMLFRVIMHRGPEWAWGAFPGTILPVCAPKIENSYNPFQEMKYVQMHRFVEEEV